MSGQERTPLPFSGKGGGNLIEPISDQLRAMADAAAAAAADAPAAPAGPAGPAGAAAPAAPAAPVPPAVPAVAVAAPAVPAPRRIRLPDTFTRQRGVWKHVATTHLGTVCQVPGCGHTTGTDARMKAHLKAAHQRSRRVRVAGADRFQCAWPGCVRTFTRTWDANTCFGRHQADAFAAPVAGPVAAPAPAQQQQQQQSQQQQQN
ncbi:uncharacterized protein PG986_005588 [Apiospora aurea]|uniref:C2H2-type domain-containing protein n=1 Tax=Apiospora aurea TaxID=335848 RepID=A0ABR1QJE9_9PEZI